MQPYDLTDSNEEHIWNSPFERNDYTSAPPSPAFAPQEATPRSRGISLRKLTRSVIAATGTSEDFALQKTG